MRWKIVLLFALCFFSFGFWGGDDADMSGPGFKEIRATWNKHYPTKTWEAAGLCGGLAVLVNGDVPYWVDSDGKVYAANGWTRSFSPNIPYSPTIAEASDIETVIKNKIPVPSGWAIHSKLPEKTLGISEKELVQKTNQLLKEMDRIQELKKLTPGGDPVPGWYHDGLADIAIHFESNSKGLARVSILAKGRGKDNRHLSAMIIAMTMACSSKTTEEAQAILFDLFPWAKEHNGQTAFGYNGNKKYSFTKYGEGAGNFMRYEISAEPAPST